MVRLEQLSDNYALFLSEFIEKINVNFSQKVKSKA